MDSMISDANSFTSSQLLTCSGENSSLNDLSIVLYRGRTGLVMDACSRKLVRKKFDNRSEFSLGNIANLYHTREGQSTGLFVNCYSPLATISTKKYFDLFYDYLSLQKTGTCTVWYNSLQGSKLIIICLNLKILIKWQYLFCPY